jgi:hypothetical protein
MNIKNETPNQITMNYMYEVEWKYSKDNPQSWEAIDVGNTRYIGADLDATLKVA